MRRRGRVRHPVVRRDMSALLGESVNRNPVVNRWISFLRPEESKEQRAAEAVAAHADGEVLSSDSCSNTEDIQHEGAVTPA